MILILSIILKHKVIIVVNTRLLIKDKLDGIGWFTFETLKRITQNNPEHTFYFLFDRAFSNEFIFSDKIIPVVLKPKARHPFLWYWWFEFKVAGFLKKVKPDLFLSPDGYLCLRTKVKSLAVIHDINFFHRPKDLPFFSRLYYNRYFPKFARKSCRVVTVSEFSKQDIATSYGIDPNEIDVVYNGAHKIYQPIDNDRKQKIKGKYSDGKDYFIFIGSMHPRKNITGLFNAFNKFKIETGSDFKLIVVGSKFFMTKAIEKAYSVSEFKNDIVFTGRLNPEDLHELLAGAYCMTFIPFYEGFGIPVIEAFNCDVPVICSDKTSLPEVAGEAALFVDPNDIQAIKNAMKRITEDNELRNNLIEAGKIQREKYNWEYTSDKLWKSILKSNEIHP